MAEASKDTIYVDIDDEITSIIDKVTSAKHGIIALVLPKRATVFQSIVNMKLLKKSSESKKKKVVLITSEASILPLAGAVKLHVAKTLQSKPSIPHAPSRISGEVNLDDAEEVSDVPKELVEDSEEYEMDDTSDIDSSKSVAELSGDDDIPAKSHSKKDDVIEIDNQEDKDSKDSNEKGGKPHKSKKDKLKIPNFEQFRTRFLLIGGGLVLLIIFWIFASIVFPKAKIIIKTDSISVNTNLTFTASASRDEFDQQTSVVPAQVAEVTKTDTEKVPATGKKNVGEKAKGTVSIKLKDCSKNKTFIPAGSSFSSDNLTYITQVDVTLISFVSGGDTCRNDLVPSETRATINVIAQSAGEQFNINGGRKFAINGFSNVEGTDSSAMTGGTNKEVTVVSDADIETAKTKLKDKSKKAALSELVAKLDDGDLLIIKDSINGAEPVLTPTPAVGSEASEVTVTSSVVYSLFGVNRKNLNKLVVDKAKKEIDTSKQTISEDGLDKALFKVIDRPTSKDVKFTVDTTVSTGAQIDKDKVKTEVAGKKSGQIKNLLEGRPSIKSVDVKLSPFWVVKAPSKADKIEIVIEQAN